MIVTDDCVFVHLHKSGGTFVNEILLRYGRNPRRIGYHLPYREAPADVRHLPVLGTLRNPLGYYVSWYHFQWRMRRPNALFVLCSDAGALGFAETIRNLLQLEGDGEKLDILERLMPEHFQTHGINLTKRCIRELRGCGTGFYSFLVRRMYADANRLTLIQTEQLRNGLLEHCADLLPSFRPDVVEFIKYAPRINTSMHDPEDQLYTKALRELVRVKDAYAVALHRALSD